MSCADPTLCYEVGNGKIYRSFSLIAKKYPFLLRAPHLVFDCRKCVFCRKKQSYELASKCVLHSSLYDSNCFITLTYDEKRPGYHNEFDYSDIQLFKKRFRQYVWREFGRRIEIFNVHEYGKNGKKHWHLVCFNHDFGDKEVHTYRNGIPLYTSKKLEELWPFGFNTIGDVSEASAMYVAQYTQKDFQHGNVTGRKKSHSKHSGIGKPFFLRHYKQILSLGYVPFDGKKMPLPRYFEKLAHKHYCHFYDHSAFYPTDTRKEALYSMFKGTRLVPGPLDMKYAWREVAELFIKYKALKNEKISEMALEWEDVISQHLTDKEVPDFMKSADNFLYDLKNKQKQERF